MSRFTRIIVAIFIFDGDFITLFLMASLAVVLIYQGDWIEIVKKK